MEEKDAPIAFSPGFRWGTSLLPGSSITIEDVLNQTAITYPYTTVNEMSGAQIKTVLEDVCDNLFNPDPYYQQGGDMVRVGGLEYTCEPNAKMGERIQDMRLDGKLARCGQDLQGRGLGAGVGSRARQGRRADLGSGGKAFAQREGRQGDHAECAQAQGCGGQPGHRLNPVENLSFRRRPESSDLKQAAKQTKPSCCPTCVGIY